MRVCYFGTYRSTYSRNVIMIEGLRRAGVEVIECHEALWHGIEDRVNTVKGAWKHPRFWGRLIKVYSRLILKAIKCTRFDVMVVGYPGQLDVFVARLICWLRRKPLAWDIFMSVYLISIERGLEKNSKLAVSLLRWIEKAACCLPDVLIMDTPDYRDWFQKIHSVPANKIKLVPTGADNSIFFPGERRRRSDRFQVTYYGSFIPNHGTQKIVEAARILMDENQIHLELIGDGPEKALAVQMAEQYNLQNITFTGWLSKPELVSRLQETDVCLGAFGNTPQSLMTVQNKIYEGLAVARPVLTGDSPAIQRAFEHLKHLYLCERTPEAIAKAILDLYHDPDLCDVLSREGYEAYLKGYTVEKLGDLVRGYLASVCHR